MSSSFDLIVIGSGPGGYVAAIRASQLGMKVAVVEKAEIGGICLNWGCIPTKALLKSAQVFEYIKHASDYGVEVSDATVNFDGMVKRSRDVAAGMSKGIEFLFKKNKIEKLLGHGKLIAKNQVEVTAADGSKTAYHAKNIILADQLYEIQKSRLEALAEDFSFDTSAIDTEWKQEKEKLMTV